MGARNTLPIPKEIFMKAIKRISAAILAEGDGGYTVV